MLSSRKISGSAPPAPRTVWFSALADKYNYLTPLADISISGMQQVTQVAANYGNQWTPVASSLGGFITAPDGTTNTAQRLVEDGSTGTHYLCAGFGQGNNLFYNTRIAVYAKADTRSRIVLVTGIYAFAGTVTMRCVFDLANGVALTPSTVAFTTKFTNMSATIQPAGGGWFMCMLDGKLFMGVPPNQDANISTRHRQFFQILLDAGTGGAAENSSYTGTGGGAYIWRTNSLNPRIWAMNSVTMFDDFNNLNTIDVNNTKAPNFHWYMDPFMPQDSAWAQSGVFSPSIVSASSSILSFGPRPNFPSVLAFPNSNIGISSVTFPGKKQILVNITANFNTTFTTITMAPNPGTVVPGMIAHLNGPSGFGFVGVVQSYVGTSLVLTANAARIGGTADQMLFTNGYSPGRGPDSYPNADPAGGGSIVGNTFKAPFCTEVSAKWPDSVNGNLGNGFGFIGWGLRQAIRPYNPFFSPPAAAFSHNLNIFYDSAGRQTNTGELDIIETNFPNGYQPGSSIFEYGSLPNGPELGHGDNFVGFPPWGANHGGGVYFDRQKVNYLGNFYWANGGVNPNVAPPGSNWVLWNPATAPNNEPINPHIFDYTNQFATFTMITLPATQDDTAHVILFSNGNFVRDTPFGFNPAITGDAGTQCYTMFEDDWFFSFGGTTNDPCSIDFIRITQ